jgi:DNA-binding beta-propeller fold protein YncE
MTPFATDGYAWGSHPGVAIDSPNRIFVIQRGEFRLPDPLPSEFAGFVGSIGLNALRPEGARVWKNCIFIVDSDGDLVETWDQWDQLFEGSNGPHKIRISPYDPERRIWVVHETGHQVFAFSNDGSELLLTLGEKDVSGSDETHFGRPQDVAFMPDGRILVADGLDNSRVVMFDPEGTYITHFGEKGTGRGEFDGVHAVATSADGRIYVADRNNDRIQVFNETTRAAAWYHPNIAPIGVWPGFDFPNDIIIDGYNVWIADNQPPKIVRTDLNGNREYTWDIAGEGPGQYRELHQFAVDGDGNMYGADNVMGRTLKFVPKANANPVDLIRMQESAATSNP